jgi:hypothetical protein
MFNTKNIKADSGKARPVIDAGNHKIRINSMSFEQTPYDKEAYKVVLHVETEPLDGEFQGFLKDKNNPSGGRYQGQVGRVRFQQYDYKDTVLPSGIEIKRDKSILKSMVFLAETLDMRDELDSIQAQTLNEFMDACNKIFSNSKFFNACICGKEWENKEGYVNLDLFLAKRSLSETSIESCDVEHSRLVKFDPEKHIIKIKKKPVTSFESSDNFTGDDFDL